MLSDCLYHLGIILVNKRMSKHYLFSLPRPQAADKIYSHKIIFYVFK